jgi:hypothetical protein
MILVPVGSINDPRSMSPVMRQIIWRAVRRERQTVREEREEELAPIALVFECCTKIRELRSRGDLDLLHELR